MTKRTTADCPGQHSEDTGVLNGDTMVREVAHMVAEWERSDELPTEFARRLVDYFRRQP